MTFNRVLQMKIRKLSWVYDHLSRLILWCGFLECFPRINLNISLSEIIKQEVHFLQNKLYLACGSQN